MRNCLLITLLIFITITSFAQDEFLHSKDGRTILKKRELFKTCLTLLHKNQSDQTAVSICECQVDKIDWHFTYKQFKNHTSDGIIDIAELIKEDTLLEKEIKECFTNTGKTFLLLSEGSEKSIISNCIKSIQSHTRKNLDSIRISDFCNCQLELIKKKKPGDAEIKTLNDPNSLFFYEMIYFCGDPFSDTLQKNWSQDMEKDISGPPIDTFKILTLDGMTYVKVKIGKMTRLWLFDTGASDLLISNEMESTLKNENIISETNYLGIGEYEMANGIIDTCRRYKIDNIKIGHFNVNNVIVAVTDKGKKIIVGKALLNKFSSWILNNKNNTLILTK